MTVRTIGAEWKTKMVAQCGFIALLRESTELYNNPAGETACPTRYNQN
jgi:hypothetical protein